MAFLRFSRDKRGYENFYLVETSTNRRGKTRARVLYWFRTPPGVKVGREPFDPEVRRALEAQNPTVVFDWRKIAETPIPSADAERWRERRRLERAERARRRGAPPEDVGDEGSDEVVPGTKTEPDVMSVDLTDADGTGEGPLEEAPVAAADSTAPDVASTSNPASVIPDEFARRRRRRRRRGRHRRPDTTVAVEAEMPSSVAAEIGESKESLEVPPARESGDPSDPDKV